MRTNSGDEVTKGGWGELLGSKIELDHLEGRRTSARYAISRLAALCVVAIPLGAVTVTGAVEGGGRSAGELAAAIMIAVALLGGAAVLARFRSIAYAEQPGSFSIRYGTLVKHIVSFPVGRVQMVDVSCSPLDRMFDTATVTIVAPGAVPRRLPGIRTLEAHRIREVLAGKPSQ